ncbi:MAG: type VI secretion system baseplate subunit TssG, partial [Pirellulaceae bacterium]
DSSTSQASSMTEEASVSKQSSVRQDNKPSGPIGGFVQPAQECLQFTVPSSQAFPGSSIQAVTWDAQQRRPRVSINFMGLTGPSGTLPRSYTSRLQQIELVARHRERHALRDWLDNFNHRFVSLFFDAWAKYRFPIGIRRQAIRSRSRKPTPTLIHVALSSIGGLGLRDVGGSDTSHEPSGDAVKRDELLGLAGLLAQRPMNVSNLQSALSRCLGVPVCVRQFEGSWLDLEESSQTKLGRDNSKLGRDAFLGERIRTRQQKIRIEVGPLCKEEFSRFLPPSEANAGEGYQRLCELVRTCVGADLEFDIQPILKIETSWDLQLSAKESVSRLGIDSWLGSPRQTLIAADAVFSGVRQATANRSGSC